VDYLDSVLRGGVWDCSICLVENSKAFNVRIRTMLCI